MRLLLLFLATAALAYPQWLSFGVKGGVPVTDTFKVARSPNLSYLSKTDRWTLGPMLEVRLPFGIGIEANALYGRMSYESESELGAARTKANGFRFPFLLKKRFGEGSVKPYLGAGPTFERLYGISQVTRFFTGSPSATNDPEELRKRSNTGGTVEAGIEFNVLGAKIAPEIRFTRWGSHTFLSTAQNLLKFNRNQAEFLLGISF
jgi:hypothetical protein